MDFQRGLWATGHPITGERKTKMAKDGPRSYVYYRCARYTKPGHPRVRIQEAEFDRQILAIFDKMRIEDESSDCMSTESSVCRETLWKPVT
jgi:hypothetical protein